MSNADKKHPTGTQQANGGAAPTPAAGAAAAGQAKPTQAAPSANGQATATTTAAAGDTAPAGNPAATGSAAESAPAEDESDPLMYFIVTGPVHSFKTVAKAEKFLNEPGAPAEYTVIRGRAAPAKKRVSLRG